MGLCKCPKRQVTNQFCFEHRVNVCEHCMVTNHPKCIVQSYLQWLKDSDYISNCVLCSKSLIELECIRLVCYHVFHWDCLNSHQSSLHTNNTAPGGHVCPMCKHPIFPPINLISPVADILRKKLENVSWSKDEFGVIMINDAMVNQTTQNVESPAVHNILENNKLNGVSDNNKTNFKNPHSVLLMDSFNPPLSDFHANSRRSLLPRESPIGGTDRDDNKYKRRTPAEIFSRWSRRFYAPSSRPLWRRTWFLIVFGCLVFILVLYLMAKFGRDSDENYTYDNNKNFKHYE